MTANRCIFNRRWLRSFGTSLHQLPQQERPSFEFSHGSKVDTSTLAEMVQACASSRALDKGRLVHEHITRRGLGGDTFLGNSLIHMYLKCGAVTEARRTLYNMKEQTTVSWTVKVGAFSQNGYHKEAISIFKEMQQNGLHPDKVALVTALGACASCESLADGKQIHSHVAELGLEQNSTIGSALVNMYGRCEKLDAAISVFGKLDPLHVGSWSSMIGACTNSQDDILQAFTLYRRMLLQGVQPDSVTFVSCVKACTMKSALKEGRELHQHILECGVESEVFLSNALVNMYGKCGSPEDAFSVFSSIQTLSVVSWTSIIGICAQYSHLGSEAISLFEKMQLEGVRPNKVTMVAVLRACNSSSGRQVHRHILEAGIYVEVAVGNALVDMYCKSGAFEDAKLVLQSMHRRDVVSWNIMISGYSQCGNCMESLKCLWLMQQDGLLPTKVTYLTLLNACSSEEDLIKGRTIHGSVIDSGLHTEEVVKSFLLGMYGKCGTLEDVQRSAAQVSEKNTIAWNTIIGALARHGKHEQAYFEFQRMQLDGVKTDAVTFVLLMGTCDSPRDLAKGMALHRWLAQLGYESLIALNSLMGMYAKCGTLEAAEQVFQTIPLRNNVSWNALISAYIQQGCFRAADKLFRHMQQEGVRADEVTFLSLIDGCSKNASMKAGQRLHQLASENGSDSNVGVANALIVMYGKFGDLQGARDVFDSLEERNTVSWNAFLAAYVEQGFNKDALKLFWEMKTIPPDKVTFVAALEACANLNELARGKQVHRFMVECQYCRLDIVLATALINMYGKCGSPEEARKVFEALEEKDVVCWTSIIVAYAQHNECEQALKLMKVMEQEGVKADDVVFVSILSGCDHAGLLEAGCKYFASMVDDYNFNPRLEHYNCMIDILGRTGHLDVAEKLIDRLPSRMDYKVWMTLLAACKMHGNTERAIRAAQRIVQLDPGNPAAYVVLSNAYTF